MSQFLTDGVSEEEESDETQMSRDDLADVTAMVTCHTDESGEKE